MPKRITIDNSPTSADTPSNPAVSHSAKSAFLAKNTTEAVFVPPTHVQGDPAGIKPDSMGHVHNTGADMELWKHSGKSSLSAFCVYPRAMNFEGRQTDEEVVLLLRAHIITNVPWIVVATIASILPVVLGPILVSFNILPALSLGLGIILTLFWYAGVFTYSFLNFLYWFFNVYIVTDERIIDVDWYSVVNRDMKFADLTSIQDVTAGQFGVLAGVFDFGDVKIETAGTEPNISFAKVPHPQIVSKKIQELREAEQAEERGGNV